jgi:hypothetical protein
MVAGHACAHLAVGRGADCVASAHHVNQLTSPGPRRTNGVNYTVNVLRRCTYRIECLYAYQNNAVTFDLDSRPAAHVWQSPNHQLPSLDIRGDRRDPTPEADLHLLTFRYGQGNHFAYFDRDWVGEPFSSARPKDPTGEAPACSQAPACQAGRHTRGAVLPFPTESSAEASDRSPAIPCGSKIGGMQSRWDRAATTRDMFERLMEWQQVVECPEANKGAGRED